MRSKNDCPLGASITLEDLIDNLHPVLHRLRQTEPVSWLPVINAWLVTDYNLSVEVMRDAKIFTVDHPGFTTAQVVGPSMLSLDGETHWQHRQPFEAPFRKRAVDGRFQTRVIQEIGQLIDRFQKNGQADLQHALAGPIAVQTMIHALGLENSSITAVLGWYDQIVDAVTRVSAGEPLPASGKAAFAALRQNLLPALHQNPAASLLAAASGAATGLTNDEIISNAAVLLFGGIETTIGMIANALFFLLTNPTVMPEVRRSPALLPAVLEETLRLEPAASVVDRYATEDVHLHDAQIKAGELVRVSLSGANRDPAVFPNPDEFKPHRPNLRSHVTFAQGPHVCLGIHLARLEVQAAVGQVLLRLPNLWLDGDTAVLLAQPRGLIFRKPEALQVRWDVH